MYVVVGARASVRVGVKGCGVGLDLNVGGWRSVRSKEGCELGLSYFHVMGCSLIKRRFNRGSLALCGISSFGDIMRVIVVVIFSVW